jgi:hypothetical protein
MNAHVPLPSLISRLDLSQNRVSLCITPNLIIYHHFFPLHDIYICIYIYIYTFIYIHLYIYISKLSILVPSHTLLSWVSPVHAMNGRIHSGRQAWQLKRAFWYNFTIFIYLVTTSESTKPCVFFHSQLGFRWSFDLEPMISFQQTKNQKAGQKKQQDVAVFEHVWTLGIPPQAIQAGNCKL